MKAFSANPISVGQRQAGGTALAVGGSVANEADVVRLFDRVKSAYQRVDILVNNAGVYAFGAVEAITVEEYRRQFDTNLLGIFLSTKSRTATLLS